MTERFQARCPAIECDGCANSIKRSLGKLTGVQSVAVDIPAKSVVVTYDDTELKASDIASRLEVAGYPVG